MQRQLKISDRFADIMAVVPTPLASDLRRCAILLDIDGTILDFAPSPRQVSVPAGLQQTLTRLQTLTGGALALVSGRSLGDIDLIFSPQRFAAIGVHGAEMRTRGDAPVQTRTVPLSDDLKRALAKVAALAPGILVEDKGYSLALHYRQSPASEPNLLGAVRSICAGFPQEAAEILPGKFVVDIKPAAINKGDAVRALMQLPPFAGRHPIFIGDDLTDLSVFDIVPQFGGRAYSVGGLTADVDGHFDTPEIVRSWLARIAAEGLGATG
ncbi:MAG: trehalose-phosphatase [Xanthobacteraceae bacterium]